MIESAADDLLQSNVLDPPAFLTQQLLQAAHQLNADVGGRCRKVQQDPVAIFKDVEAETIVSVERRKRSVDGLDASAISLLVAGRPHQDGDLLGGMIDGDVPICDGHV